LLAGFECRTQDYAQHETECPGPKAKNFVFEVYLVQTLHIQNQDPPDPVSRGLSIPSSLTFDDLHRAIGIAFGWCEKGEYEFESQRESCKHISSRDSTVDGKKLNSWDNVVDSTRHKHGSRIQVDEVIKDKDPENQLMWLYKRGRYDTGNARTPYYTDKRWVHRIIFKGVDPKNITKYPICFGGFGHGPAEGLSELEWEALKKAYLTQHPTP
jgi:hypothetical protein